MASEEGSIDEYVAEEFPFKEHRVTIYRKNLAALPEDYVDPNLFDADYSPAVATGLARVWEGTWLLLELLQSSVLPSPAGLRIIELGAGTGLAGLCAACMGHHVLLTDVPSVVALLGRNILANSRSVEPGCGPHTTAPASTVPAWHGAVPVGAGTAAAAALDWTVSAEQQLNGLPLAGVDLVIASEVIWLQELIEPFARTLASLLSSRQAVCIMTYTSRGTADSQVFTHESAARSVIEAHGCRVQALQGFSSSTTDGEQVVAWKVTM